jgi:uncharacterized protein
MPAKKKKSPRRRAGRKPARHFQVRALFAALLLLGFLLLALVLLPQLKPVRQDALPPAHPPSPGAEVVVEGMPAEPEEVPAVPPLLPESPRVAIIMDDLGRDLATARNLLAMDFPVTFAILPGEPQAARVAALAHRGGREVMIHIPMEPRGYPGVNPGGDALFIHFDQAEIRRRFQEYLEKVPYATGGNNHMGSRFTEYREGMAVVLEMMHAENFFFVDSLTTEKSIAMAEAGRLGVPAISRDIFLDNIQDVDQISREIRKLAVMAIRRGQAVAICHPYPETLEALRREVPLLRQQGIEIVPVSQLLPR